MNRIFYIIGRSGSGKDTIFNELLKREELKELNLQKIILHTTRPMRDGERNGNEYYFVTDEEFLNMESEKKFIETRAYNTCQGIWRYGTSMEKIDLEKYNYLTIGTPASYSQIRSIYKNKIVPIRICVDENELYKRTVQRALNDPAANKEELDRRFEADKKDFKDGIFQGLGIREKFENNGNLKDCVDKIVAYIKCSACVCNECLLGSDECYISCPCLECENHKYFKRTCDYVISKY